MNFIHFFHLFSEWGHLHCKNVSPPQYSNRSTVLGSNGHREYICSTSHIQHLYSFETLLASNHDTYSTFLYLQCFNAVAITCFWPCILWQNWNGCSAGKTNIFRVFCFFIKTVRLSWRGGVGMAWKWVNVIMLVVNQGLCNIRIISLLIGCVPVFLKADVRFSGAQTFIYGLASSQFSYMVVIIWILGFFCMFSWRLCCTLLSLDQTRRHPGVKSNDCCACVVCEVKQSVWWCAFLPIRSKWGSHGIYAHHTEQQMAAQKTTCWAWWRICNWSSSFGTSDFWTIRSFVTALRSFAYSRKRFCPNYQTNTLTGWVSLYFIR